MVKKIAIFAAVVFLSGCVAQKINKGLDGLVGQNIQTAIAALGYPDGQREIMGDKIYIWSTNRQALLPFTNTTTANGMVGGTPYYGTAYQTQMVPVAAQCTIQIATTEDGTIKRYQWEGNMIGCDRYAHRF